MNDRVFDADIYSVAGRLALELECLLLDTKDMSVVSKWWDSAHDALEQWRSIKDTAPQPVQEPIGNISLWHNHGYQNHNVEYYGTLPDGLHQLYAAPVKQTEQEPVACQHKRYSVDVQEQTGYCIDCGADGRMRFVVGDTPSASKPLPEIVLRKIYCNAASYVEFYKAYQAAHGIKE